LSVKLGEATALGWLVLLWRFAQEHYRKDKTIIPSKSYEFYGFPDELIDFEFVEKRKNGYYVKGSKRNFEWIFKGIEQRRKAGKKSAEIRKKKFGSAIPCNARNLQKNPKNPNKDRTPVRTLPNGTEPSSSSSSSSSTSKYNSNNSNSSYYDLIEEKKLICCKSKVSKPTTPGSEVWFSYADAYERKYRTSPIRNSKTNSQCKRLIYLVGKENACKIVKHYLTINDQFYIKKAHDIGLCITDYQKILTSAETGINITTTKATQVDKMQTNRDAFREVSKMMEENYEKINGNA